MAVAESQHGKIFASRTIELQSVVTGESIQEVRPSDTQRYKVQTGKLTDVLRLRKQAREFSGQFELLQVILANWIHAHGKFIQKGMLTLQDDSLTFLVIQITSEYNEDLIDALADLAFEVADDPALDLIELNTLAIPPVSEESLQTFLDHRLALSYSGHRT